MVLTAFKPVIFWYLRKPRNFNYRGLRIKVFPGVFHPGLFISTKYLLRFIETLPIKNASLLELGAGSGAVGFYAEQLGAHTSLTDISERVVKGLEYNKKQLGSKAHIVQSDLFDNVSNFFDFIIVNPPYYPKTPKSEEEMAWFCGENFEYFQRFFSGLKAHLNTNGKCYMILSEDCEIATIKEIGTKQGFEVSMVSEKRILREWNYIFLIHPTN